MRIPGLHRPLRRARGRAVDGRGRHQRDNAACESFHASLKRETLQGAHDYGDAGTCRRTVFAWLTRYNNTRRRHSTNGHLSPNAYERRHHTAKLTLAA
ncbi:MULTISPECIES: integrase core domain-containing protein [unclassified Streptomyces]|uniref:integrase core domain-containing protein n=1 Tax=unclassified Streptomyces TaxID=2593676 RepID=UPI002E330332|nr:integrase core domain-containing protein [Streptomyces sp. NBC_01724]